MIVRISSAPNLEGYSEPESFTMHTNPQFGIQDSALLPFIFNSVPNTQWSLGSTRTLSAATLKEVLLARVEVRESIYAARCIAMDPMRRLLEVEGRDDFQADNESLALLREIINKKNTPDYISIGHLGLPTLKHDAIVATIREGYLFSDGEISQSPLFSLSLTTFSIPFHQRPTELDIHVHGNPGREITDALFAVCLQSHRSGYFGLTS